MSVATGDDQIRALLRGDTRQMMGICVGHVDAHVDLGRHAMQPEIRRDVANPATRGVLLVRPADLDD